MPADNTANRNLPTPDHHESGEDLVLRRLSAQQGKDRSIPRVDRDGPLALSFDQQRLLFLSQLEPGSPAYLVPLGQRILGELDPATLSKAWTGLLQRHEILRTRYQFTGTEPVQVIDRAPASAIQVSDLTGLPAGEREREASRIAQDELATPIDLGREHPVRMRLVRLAPDDHLLIMVLHHIASDDMSVAILAEDLGALYASAVTGAPPGLPPLRVQYADYAAWQRQRLSGDALDKELNYWWKRLDGLAPLHLPTDRPRPAVRGWRGGRITFSVPADLAESLREVGREHDATLFTVLLTAFQVLLGRLAGQCDIAVGSAVARRNHADLRRVAGFFLNTLVMRATWEDDPEFGEFLDRNRTGVVEALDHQNVPLHHLVDTVEKDRDLSRTPLFQVMFDLIDSAPVTIDLPGLAVEPVPLAGEIAKFDLTFQIGSEADGTLSGAVEYATDLFDRTTVERIAASYVRLLESSVRNPATRLSGLDILTPRERRQLLTEWNDTELRRPWSSVPAAIARQAKQSPEAVALVAGTQRVSYAELDARASRLAGHLRELGISAESVVGVCLDRSPDLIVALLAVWKAGGAYLPLDPTHPQERLAYMLADSGAVMVITESSAADSLTGRFAGPILLMDRDLARSDQRQPGPAADPAPDSLAYIIYTSGTTGRPKGVLISHAGLANYLDWTVEAYASGSPHGIPLFASAAFDLVVPNIYTALMTGRCVHILPPRIEADELGALLAASAPFAFVKLTPRHLDLLTNQLSAEQAARLAGTVVVAGDAFSAGLLERWRQLTSGSAAQLINEYGPTEITVGNSTYPVRGQQRRELMPIGRPIPNTTAYVLDSGLRLLPVGVVGEVYVGGSGVARGYQGQPALTAERFVPDPYGRVPGGRLYKTGDLARVLPSGDFEFAGRTDDQVKIRGYRIEPAEVESALTEHPQVIDVVVIASWDQLISYLIPAGQPPTASELRRFLADRLPEYMIPSAFVALDAFPLTANGKVDHRALPAPEGTALRPAQDYVPPRTALEERIAATWRKALEVGQVGVHDNFFDLGGDSIRAIGLIGALRDAGLDVTMRDLFQERTVAGLAEFITGQPAPAEQKSSLAPFELLDAADVAAMPSGIVDAYPLSQVQAGMVFEMLADPEAPYHNGTSYRIQDGRPFSLEAFREAARIVVARHEALRTSIDLATFSCPVQLVHAEAEMSVGAQDLRHMSWPEHEREIHRYMQAERRNLFDFAKPPLLRLFAHVTADDSWWISITECHPVIEGWGYHQMLMELHASYLALLDGRRPELEPLSGVRFADFIAAELESMRSVQDRDYWRRTIATAPALTLPVSWGGGPKEEHPVYEITIGFDDLRGALLDLASQARVPLKSVLHAAHLKVMSMLTIEPAFTTGLVCDCRPEVTGSDSVIGMYLNTVPFAFGRCEGSWLDLVRAVFAREVELWPHRRYPMPVMQRELADDQRLNQVLFNYLDFHAVDTRQVDIYEGIDYSPNEFQLVIVAQRAGTLRISAKPETVSRQHGELLAAMYRRVLEAMAADPAGAARPHVLPPSEWQRVIRASNETDVPWPQALTHGLFEDQARSAPDAIAVIDADGGTVTYRELNQRANRIAWYLRGLGVRAEDFVGICLEHSVDQLAALLGILKSGGAYVPLDPTHPASRLAFMLADTGAQVVISAGALHQAVPDGTHRMVLLDGDAAEIATAPATDPDPCTTPDNLVYAMYTSGSTGRPKGVMISHRGLNNYLLWAVEGYGLAGAHGAPMLGSIAFDLSVPNFFLPLIGGQDVTLLPPDPGLERLAGLLRQSGDFSLLKITPAHLDVLRAQVPDDARIDSVRTFVVGADEVKPETVAAWRQRAPGARIIDEYGPTETVVGCSIYIIPEDFDPSAPVPIGKPIANIRMYVLDSDLEPVPAGVVGELYIGGVGVARGYLGRPDLTAERFLPDPFTPNPGDRIYRTGDLARLRRDGNLEFLGRIDNQVKIRGYRIEPAEIEARLLLHPGVREAVVVASQDSRGGKRLVAYTVPTGPTPPNATELRRFLSDALPVYMIPAVFVVLRALPLSTSGKVDRAQLPAPAVDRPDLSSGYVSPRTPTERVLADIWAEVLQVDRVGVRDSFLDLGGHSLAALTLAGRIQAVLRTPMRMTSLLQSPTVESQARLIDGHDQPGEDTPLVAIRTGESGTPLVLVHAAGGNVLCFADLARQVSTPVYALAARGLDTSVRPLATIEEMAAEYLRAIGDAGLSQEIVLGGWSMGGLVAYEMARRVRAQSGQILPLLLIDSYAPGTEQEQVDTSDPAFLAWFAYDWGQGLGLDFGITAEDLAAREPGTRLAAILERARATGAVGAEADLATLSRVAEVARANVRAAMAYRPVPDYPGPITVLSAADEPATAADPAHGWQAWTTGTVRATAVPGNHYTVLRSPNLDLLAAEIRSSLRAS